MPTIALTSGTIHYQETGHGQPLILLHANPGDCRDYSAVIPKLAQHFRVLALDWPGYGQSSLNIAPETVTASFFTAVLREFITALNLPPVLLIGNSLGGNAAARLASESPKLVRAVVLVSPGGFTAHNIITHSFCRLQGSRFALSPTLWARLYLRKSTPQTKAMLKRAAGEQTTEARLAQNRALWRSFATDDNDLRPLAANIKAPVLLMFGKYDPAIPAHKDGKVAHQCFPHAQFVALPCGHAPFAEIPHDFLTQVLPFLAQCVSNSVNVGMVTEPPNAVAPLHLTPP